jgi:threonylcarbamoyladenosine tRNA methylthiotransferase MtaB
MAGFPGETEAEFDEGYHFIAGMQFDGMHVFKYSQRSGTRAARMPDQVPEGLKKERSRLLRDESAAGVERLISRHLGKVGAVAWESESDGLWRGLTDTNVRVYGTPPTSAACGIAHIRLTSPFADGLWAEPASVEIPLLPVS